MASESFAESVRGACNGAGQFLNADCVGQRPVGGKCRIAPEGRRSIAHGGAGLVAVWIFPCAGWLNPMGSREYPSCQTDRVFACGARTSECEMFLNGHIWIGLEGYEHQSRGQARQ